MHTAGKMPHIPVYVDSPLAINATSIMRKHTESFNPEIKEYMKVDPNPFGYDDVHYIQAVEDSIELNESADPCIIISASGMMEAGRIKHHIKNNIEHPNCTILIVGYVTPNSLGGKLKDGAKEVKIFGEPYQVLANIEVIDSYSAHADYKELIQFLSCQDPTKVKKVFLVHGEPEAQDEFKAKLQGLGYDEVKTPEMGESFEI
jgi:metallo-beta-lactamase family protein